MLTTAPAEASAGHEGGAVPIGVLLEFWFDIVWPRHGAGRAPGAEEEEGWEDGGEADEDLVDVY